MTPRAPALAAQALPRPNQGLWRPVDALARRAARPVDGASAAVFRIAFGAIGLAAVIRFFAHGWIDQLYLAPAHHFKYIGFEWVAAWPAPWMHLHFAALALLAIAVILGIRSRPAVLLFTIGFTYVELIDKTTYLNHYYWLSLAGLLLAALPVHRAWTLDARRNPKPGDDRIPVGAIWLLRAQIAVLYLFAGIAKLNPDWLLHAQPLAIWLPHHADAPLIGPLMTQPWLPYAMSWAGAAFDCTIALWLLIPRTRPAAWLVLAAFHLITGLLFPIGVFPALMAAAALVFFNPDWPRHAPARALNRLNRIRPTRKPEPLLESTRTMLQHSCAKPAEPPKRPARIALPARLTVPARLTARLAVIAVALIALVQIAVPLRHHLYPGNVRWNEEAYRFSWRVLLTDKTGHLEYRVADPATGLDRIVRPGDHFTPLQVERMARQPDMIQQGAKIIRDHYRSLGHPAPQVRADARVAWNGRPATPLIDPQIDLAAQPTTILPKPWLLPPPD